MHPTEGSDAGGPTEPPDIGDAGAGAKKPDFGPVRGQHRVAGFTRVSHGLSKPDLPESLVDPDEQKRQHKEFLRDLEAWRLVLPEDAVFTHITGARLRGWQLPKLPEQVPVFAASRADTRPRRPGLLCARLTHPSKCAIRQGLPVEAAEEILLRAKRDLGLLDLVILVDSARRKNDIDLKAMEKILASRRPGVRILRAAWRLSITKADSAGETLLRIFHGCLDVPVQPQAPLHDRSGNLVGMADLLVLGTQFVHEYDGAIHRGRKQHTADLRRDRGLVGTDYIRRGYTLDDLLNHAVVVMHEIDRALDRSHDPDRLARWRGLVSGSMYTERTRDRMMNRWHRDMGAVDWSKTA